MNLPKIKNKYYIILVVALIFVLILGSFKVIDETIGKIIITSYTKQNFDLDANNFKKTMDLREWFKNNYSWTPGTISDYGRLFGFNTISTFLTGKGQCGEASNLFYYMGKALDLDVRIVYNYGEGHQWNEVLLDGNWRQIDVSGDYPFDAPRQYENSGWDKKISLVYYNDENGNLVNVTDQYTDTGKLKIKVKDNNLLLANMPIDIFSLFYIDKNYRAFFGQTNQQGEFETFVGDSNYIIAVSVPVIPFVLFRIAKKEIEVLPNQTKIITFDFYTESELILNFELIVTAIIFIFVIEINVIIRVIKKIWKKEK